MSMVSNKSVKTAIARALSQSSPVERDAEYGNNEVLRRFRDESKPHVENELLYGYFVKEMRKRTPKQAKMIKDACKKASKYHSKEWDQLLNYQCNNISHILGNNQLRQDCIEYIENIQRKSFNIKSILPAIDETELSKRSALFEPENASGDFEAFEDANQHEYLSKCLVIAHTVNESFHNTMRLIVDLINNDREGTSAIYRQAPLKTRQRCINRCFKKFHDKLYPNSAHILDFVRGSIKFNNCKDMIEGINIFTKYIDENAHKGCIVSIVKCKNDFSQFLRANPKYIYCDIRFNVVICDRISGDAIIGEVQFILDWMLDAKRVCLNFFLCCTLCMCVCFARLTVFYN